MKTETRVMDVTSTLEGEKIQMAVHVDAMAHIMSVLTDLYSDPELAVIREYSTNAFDAHVETGQTRPIEVTTPTSLAPFFRVRDFGIGLDADDIREIYSQYGASTKRESDDVVGMLGLGCKSALTYTDQFTVTGIKDGICTQISVSRDENGAGSMIVVPQYETDEPSGVEIIVPAKSYNNFEAKAKHFFKFWTPGTVLVNGEEPKRIDGFWITNDILLTKEADQDLIVMGNVAYPYDSNRHYRHNRYDNRAVVAFVDIGAVNFTPSREALQMNAKTKAVIEDITVRFEAEREKAFRKAVDDAPSKWDALAVNAAENAYATYKDVTYKGQPIPHTISVERKDNVYVGDPYIKVPKNKYHGSKQFSAEYQIPATYLPNAAFFVGFTDVSFSPYKREKLMLWMNENNVNLPDNLYFVKEHPAPEWHNPAHVYKWEDVNAMKIVREKKERRDDGRPTGSYEAIVKGTPVSDLLAADIDTKKPIYYAVKNTTDQSYRSLLYKLDKNCTIVVMGNNRVAKFLRDFPKAKQVTKHVIDGYTKWAEKLTDDDKLAIGINAHSDNVFFSSLDATKIDDPDFKRAITVVNSKIVDEYNLYKRYIAAASELRYNDGTNTKFMSPIDNYPLLTSHRRYATMGDMAEEHIYLYVNAVYAARKENK